MSRLTARPRPVRGTVECVDGIVALKVDLVLCVGEEDLHVSVSHCSFASGNRSTYVADGGVADADRRDGGHDEDEDAVDVPVGE